MGAGVQTPQSHRPVKITSGYWFPQKFWYRHPSRSTWKYVGDWKMDPLTELSGSRHDNDNFMNSFPQKNKGKMIILGYISFLSCKQIRGNFRFCSWNTRWNSMLTSWFNYGYLCYVAEHMCLSKCMYIHTITIVTRSVGLCDIELVSSYHRISRDAECQV